MKKFNLLILLLFATSVFGKIAAYAQDVIIKNDKSEIKSKVLEITDTQIKYKKFDMLDGPTYNIYKTDVFMIIYKNGTKEYMDNPKPAVVVAPVTAPAQPNATAMPVKLGDNTSWDPYRLLVYSQSSSASAGGFGSVSASTVSIEFSVDFKIIRDYFNIGVGSIYSFSSASGDGTSASTSGEGGMIYGNVYLPLAKIMGQANNTGTGFYPFARVGYSYLSFSDGEGDNTSSGTSVFELGLDYKFSRNFAVTLVTSKFNSFGGGISFNF